MKSVTEKNNREILLDKYRHKPGLKAFVVIYFYGCRKQFIKSLWYSIVFTTVIVVCYLLSSKGGNLLLKTIADSCIAVAPAILGFTLSGYAIIVNVADSEILNILKKEELENGITMYQRLYTTFIAMLFSIFMTLLFGFILKVMLSFEFNYEGSNKNVIIILDIINGLFFTVGTFIMNYSVFTIKDLLSNLFSLGQVSKNVKPNNNSNINNISQTN